MKAAKKPKGRWTWKREPRETGLAGVFQSARERGWHLRWNGVRVGHVVATYKGSRYEVAGYYWYALASELGIPTKNTAYKPVATVEEAKAACLAWCQEHALAHEAAKRQAENE